MPYKDPEKKREHDKKYYDKEKVREYNKEYHNTHKKERKEYNKINKEKIIEQKKEWHRNNKEKNLRKNKEWREQNKDLIRNRRFERKYGITLEQYTFMLDQQNGVCKICKQPETRKLFGKVVALLIDHDHNTGKIRGLLCNKCNGMLGLSNDNPDILIAGAEYLVEHIKKYENG